MSRIAEVRRISEPYLVAECVAEGTRGEAQAAATDLGLLLPHDEGWRRRWARSEMIAACMYARSSGMTWKEIARVGQECAAEVRVGEGERAGR